MDRSKGSEHVEVAVVVPDTEAAGPGRRFAVWVQGCSIRCPGCCNPELFEAEPERSRSVGALIEALRGARHAIEGVSLLGGEPFEQAAPLARLAAGAHELGLSVMIFSGYRLEELREAGQREPGVAALLAATDALVDGRFEARLVSDARRWIGSSNQRVHFLGERMRRDSRFDEPDTVEIRLDAAGLTINGAPRAARRLRMRAGPR